MCIQHIKHIQRAGLIMFSTHVYLERVGLIQPTRVLSIEPAHVLRIERKLVQNLFNTSIQFKFKTNKIVTVYNYIVGKWDVDENHVTVVFSFQLHVNN